MLTQKASSVSCLKVKFVQHYKPMVTMKDMVEIRQKVGKRREKPHFSGSLKVHEFLKFSPKNFPSCTFATVSGL